MVERVCTILGGLPVIANIHFGKDADGPWGRGEFWSEVEEIWWLKRDGSKGKLIPQHVFDRAEKYDPGFCDLTSLVCEEMAHEAWIERETAAGRDPDAMHGFDGAEDGAVAKNAAPRAA